MLVGEGLIIVISRSFFILCMVFMWKYIWIHICSALLMIFVAWKYYGKFPESYERNAGFMKEFFLSLIFWPFYLVFSFFVYITNLFRPKKWADDVKIKLLCCLASGRRKDMLDFKKFWLLSVHLYNSYPLQLGIELELYDKIKNCKDENEAFLILRDYCRDKYGKDFIKECEGFFTIEKSHRKG